MLSEASNDTIDSLSNNIHVTLNLAGLKNSRRNKLIKLLINDYGDAISLPTGSPEELLSLFKPLFDSIRDDIWRSKALTLFYITLIVSCHSRDKLNQPLSVHTIANHISSSNLLSWAYNNDIPEQARTQLLEFLQEFPGFDDSFLLEDGTQKPREGDDILKTILNHGNSVFDSAWTFVKQQTKHALKSKIDEDPTIEACAYAIRTADNDAFLKEANKMSTLDVINKYWLSLAAIAAWNGNVFALKEIKSRGGILKHWSVSINGARHSAILEYLESVDMLLPNAADHNGTTPLQQATNISDPFDPFNRCDYSLVEDRIKCFDILLRNSADIDALNNFGRCALHSAAHTDSLPLVEGLLKHNPDPTIVCNNGKTTISYATKADVQDRLRKYYTKS